MVMFVLDIVVMLVGMEHPAMTMRMNVFFTCNQPSPGCHQHKGRQQIPADIFAEYHDGAYRADEGG